MGIKITELASLSSILGTELIPLVDQSGIPTTKKASLSLLLSSVCANLTKTRASGWSYRSGRVWTTDFTNQSSDSAAFVLVNLQYGTDANGAACVYLTNADNPGTLLTKAGDIKDIEIRLKVRWVAGTTAPYVSTPYGYQNVAVSPVGRYQGAGDQWRVDPRYDVGWVQPTVISNGATTQIGSISQGCGIAPGVYMHQAMRIVEDVLYYKQWKDFATTMASAATIGATTLLLTSVAGLVARGITPATENYTTGDQLAFGGVQSHPTLYTVTAISGTTVTISPALTIPLSSGSTVYSPEPDWQHVRRFNGGADNPDFGAAGFRLVFGGAILEMTVSELLRIDDNLLINADARDIDYSGMPLYWNAYVPVDSSGSTATIVPLADRFGVVRPVFQVVQGSGSTDATGWEQVLWASGCGRNVFLPSRCRPHPAVTIPREIELSIWTKGTNVVRASDGIGPVVVVYLYDAAAANTMRDQNDDQGTGNLNHGYVAALGPTGTSPTASQVATLVPRSTAGGYERLEPSAIGTWDWTETRYRMALHHLRAPLSISVKVIFHDSGTAGTSGTFCFTELSMRPIA